VRKKIAEKSTMVKRGRHTRNHDAEVKKDMLRGKKSKPPAVREGSIANLSWGRRFDLTGRERSKYIVTIGTSAEGGVETLKMTANNPTSFSFRFEEGA